MSNHNNHKAMTLDDVPLDQPRLMQVLDIDDSSQDNGYQIHLRDLELGFDYYDNFNIQTNSIGYFKGRLAKILDIKGTTESYQTKALVEAARAEMADGAVIVEVKLEFAKRISRNAIFCYTKRNTPPLTSNANNIPEMKYKPFDSEKHYVEVLVNSEWVGRYYMLIEGTDSIGRQCNEHGKLTDLFCITFCAHRQPIIDLAWPEALEEKATRKRDDKLRRLLDVKYKEQGQ